MSVRPTDVDLGSTIIIVIILQRSEAFTWTPMLKRGVIFYPLQHWRVHIFATIYPFCTFANTHFLHTVF